jgi:excisionase family DNA binding protein
VPACIGKCIGEILATSLYGQCSLWTMESQERLLLRGEEVAELLNISRALAYRWMAAGILPVVRVPGGRSVRVPQRALLNWIETNTADAGERGLITKPAVPKRRPEARRRTGAR